jgi:hypothetical protein
MSGISEAGTTFFARSRILCGRPSPTHRFFLHKPPARVAPPTLTSSFVIQLYYLGFTKKTRSPGCFFAVYSKWLLFFGCSFFCRHFGSWCFYWQIIDCTAIEVEAGHAGSLTGTLTHVREVLAADFAPLGNFNFNN